MIKSIITGMLAFTTLGAGATTIALNTQNTSNVEFDVLFDTTITYSVADMLTLAIEDEYAAKATYQALLVLFPDQKILENLLKAEQRHIDLLIPLFETYQVELPTESDVVPNLTYTTLQEAALDIAKLELINVSMYQHFLSQSDLAADVKEVFAKLLSASTNHLQAAQRIAFDLPGNRGGINGMLNRNHRAMFRQNRRMNNYE
jgi:hypothetical protein